MLTLGAPRSTSSTVGGWCTFGVLGCFDFLCFLAGVVLEAAVGVVGVTGIVSVLGVGGTSNVEHPPAWPAEYLAF